MKEKKTFRDADFIEKAKKTMIDYNQATGSSICFFNSEKEPIFSENLGNSCPEKEICPYCPKFSKIHQQELPCRPLHEKAINEANKKGGSHIYHCEAGLVFWVCPIYTEGQFSWAVRGSGFLTKNQKTVDIFTNTINTGVMCNEKMSNDDFNNRVNSLPKADNDKVQSLSEMMQICAESLSSGSENYYEIAKHRAEQQQAIEQMIGELEASYPKDAEKPGYSLGKEKNLLNTLRKGDPVESKKLLNELIALMIFSYPNEFKYAQLRATELVVLLSRIETIPIKSGMLSMEANCKSLKAVQEAKTFEDLTGILHSVVDRLLNIISSFRGIPHAAALRKAETFILENFTRKISLKEIASVAGLSHPYFSTIFKEEMGENLSKYLNRLRVEKASRLLLETEMSLSEIASQCCFEDQSWFSKIFKTFTGISPGKYRNQGGGLNREITENNLSQALRSALA